MNNHPLAQLDSKRRRRKKKRKLTPKQHIMKILKIFTFDFISHFFSRFSRILIFDFVVFGTQCIFKYANTYISPRAFFYSLLSMLVLLLSVREYARAIRKIVPVGKIL